MVQQRLVTRERSVLAFGDLGMSDGAKPPQGGLRFGVWSTFRELLGWADNAGPMPKSLVAVGWLLGIALIVFGVVAMIALGYVVLGIITGLIGIGLVLGTLELR